jgi:hypothetical protein
MTTSSRAANAASRAALGSLAVLVSLVALVAPRSAPGQATPAPTITREAFASLRWLEGRWVGSGGGYTAFYEEYRFLNDSTIEQVEFGSDSTFRTAGGRSPIEWRAGVVQKSRNGQAQSRLARVTGDTAVFENVRTGQRAFIWYRVSANEWRAVLGRPESPTIYTLRRVAR